MHRTIKHHFKKHHKIYLFSIFGGRAIFKTVLLIVGLFGVVNVELDNNKTYAATEYRVRNGLGTTDNRSDTGNWSGGILPDSDDVAIFNVTSTKDVIIDATISIGGIDIQTGYNGTISISGSNTVSISSYFNVYDGEFYTPPTGILNFIGLGPILNINSTGFVCDGTIVSSPSLGYDLYLNVNVDDIDISNILLSGPGGIIIGGAGTLNVTNHLTGVSNDIGGSFNLLGDATFENNFKGNKKSYLNQYMNINGSSPQTITVSDQGRLPSVNLNNPLATITTYGDGAGIEGNFILNTGNLVIPESTTFTFGGTHSNVVYNINLNNDGITGSGTIIFKTYFASNNTSNFNLNINFEEVNLYNVTLTNTVISSYKELGVTVLGTGTLNITNHLTGMAGYIAGNFNLLGDATFEKYFFGGTKNYLNQYMNINGSGPQTIIVKDQGFLPSTKLNNPLATITASGDGAGIEGNFILNTGNLVIPEGTTFTFGGKFVNVTYNIDLNNDGITGSGTVVFKTYYDLSNNISNFNLNINFEEVNISNLTLTNALPSAYRDVGVIIGGTGTLNITNYLNGIAGNIGGNFNLLGDATFEKYFIGNKGNYIKYMNINGSGPQTIIVKDQGFLPSTKLNNPLATITASGNNVGIYGNFVLNTGILSIPYLNTFTFWGGIVNQNLILDINSNGINSSGTIVLKTNLQAGINLNINTDEISISNLSLTTTSPSIRRSYGTTFGGTGILNVTNHLTGINGTIIGDFNLLGDAVFESLFGYGKIGEINISGSNITAKEGSVSPILIGTSAGTFDIYSGSHTYFGSDMNIDALNMLGTATLHSNDNITSPTNRTLTVNTYNPVFSPTLDYVIINPITTIDNDHCDNSQAPAGLVSYWGFEGDANDNFGTNNGTISGAVFTGGIIGSGLSFDGIDDYVEVNYNTGFYNSLVATGNYTISFWMKGQDETSGNSPILSIGPLNGPWIQDSLILNFDSRPAQQKLQFIIQEGGNPFYQITSPVGSIQDNQSYFVTLVVEPLQSSLYIDGQLSVTGVWDNQFPPFDTVRIGRGINNAGITTADYYAGILDDLTIFNKALTSCEVAELYGRTENGYCVGEFPICNIKSYIVGYEEESDRLDVSLNNYKFTNLRKGIGITLNQAYDTVFNVNNNLGRATSGDRLITPFGFRAPVPDSIASGDNVTVELKVKFFNLNGE